MKVRTLTALAGALVALAIIPGSASAYRYDVGSLGSSGDARVINLDKTRTYTIRVTNGGVQQARKDGAAGLSSDQVSVTIQPGWVVEVYQPQAALPTPLTAPTESFTVPNLTVGATLGGTSATGTGPAGWTAMVQRGPSCLTMLPELIDAPIVGGAFSAALRSPVRGRDSFSVVATSPTGNVVQSSTTTLPGDSQCMLASAVSTSDAADDQKYMVAVQGLDPAIPTTRVVLRRGAVILGDVNDDSLALPAASKPSAGDVVDVYRPQGAPSPAYSWTIPQTSAIIDSSSSLMAIDAPPASAVMGSPCQPFTCMIELLIYSKRTSASAGGRTMVDLTPSPASSFQLMRNVLPGDIGIAGWISTDESKFLFFDAVAGDLTPPVGKLTLAKSLKAKKLGKKALKVSLSSNEVGKASSKLTIPGKTKKSKPVTLASSKSMNVKAGKNTLALKFSKTGKKSLKAISKKRKSAKATLTVRLTDASGNVTTVVKSTTIKP